MSLMDSVGFSVNYQECLSNAKSGDFSYYDSLLEKEEKNDNTNDNKIQISVFDNASVDGDIISLYLNDEPIVKKLLLDKCKVVLHTELRKGKNIITLRAENLGSIPPNTATIQINGKSINKSIVVRADLGYSESITIINE